MISRTSTVRCVAKASSNKPEHPITIARKSFEAKRSITLKENFNKLALLATADTKEISDFIKVIDELHRKEFEELRSKASQLFTKKNTTTSSRSGVETDDEENIFLSD